VSDKNFADLYEQLDNPHAHTSPILGPPDEDAYRRGFQQGVMAALDAVEQGCPPGRLAKWKDAIYRWRFDASHKKRVPHPTVTARKARASAGLMPPV
jgi:hypothetical protein